MQRWQRRAHVWLWLAIVAVVAAVFLKVSTGTEPPVTTIEIPEEP